MVDQNRLPFCGTKPRVFITTDIRNEPDDAESLVRYMLYSNEFNTRGLVACTSVHMPNVVHPEDIEEIVEAYSIVIDNLNAHVHPENQYLPAESFLSMISTGPSMYGMKALEDGVALSDGAKLLIERVDESHEPLWVLAWGGMNVVAQTLHHVQKQRELVDFAQFRSKLRIYAISDQDDTGSWIRRKFPDVFYICSVHGWKDYISAAWFGISGEAIFDFDSGGPDGNKITHQWLREHIQIGPLGGKYPMYPFLMEGDTPTFLYLIQNGLGSPEHPEWGSWGGRYTLVTLDGSKHYADASDQVVGKSGKTFRSNHATIWRWREHFQDSFAARMQWTLTNDRSKVNHAPVVKINDSSTGPEPLIVEAEAGTELNLDASQSYDPDNGSLSFEWFHYKEVTSALDDVPWHVPDIELQALNPARTQVKIRLPPAEISAANPVTGLALARGMVFHFVLQVTDSGTPPLTTYKRVVVHTTNQKMIGGSGIRYESTTASMGIPESFYWQK